MARQSVVLALIFFAVVGMAKAEGDAQATTPKNPEEAFKVISDAAAKAAPPGTTLPAMPAMGPTPGNDVIGTTDGSSHGAAPVGGPVAAGTFPDNPAESKSNGAVAVQASFAGVVATAVVGSFFF